MREEDAEDEHIQAVESSPSCWCFTCYADAFEMRGREEGRAGDDDDAVCLGCVIAAE